MVEFSKIAADMHKHATPMNTGCWVPSVGSSEALEKQERTDSTFGSFGPSGLREAA